jgi:hypothetical protein|tara:strand:+ start:3580 stop:3855 length:276 start_codon:yes stop_codon:yes gene_type:complete
MSSPADALRRTAAIIDQRAETHGDFREVFEMTAALWSAYLSMPVSPAQVCALNQMQKLARDQCAPELNDDNDLDNVGYAAIKAALGDKKGG